jgi:thiamine-monophosphate kinase
MVPVTVPADQTIADIGEFGLISLLTEAFPPGPPVVVGPGDDAAVLTLSGQVAVSTDMLVEGRHFKRDWSSAADIGHKAVAQNLSDINAMGGTGVALTVALAAPADLPVAWVMELAAGMREEAEKVGARIIGGDLSRADAITIAVTVLGSCPDSPLLRSGARDGDVVAVTGRLGWAAAGLAVLGRGFRSPRLVVDAHRRPEPPYSAGPEAVTLGATSLIDISDGLVGDLRHVAQASGVAIDLDPSAFPIPEPLAAVGAAVGADPMAFILNGGDDHALVATFPAGTALPSHWTLIGRVSSGSGVSVAGEEYGGSVGWDHFKN